MAMPRPSGKAQRIAEQVIPNLRRDGKKSRGGAVDKENIEEAEIIDISNMGNK